MSKSDIAKQVDLIQNCLRDMFKGREFRKRGRAYNRDVDDGIVQVVHFFMGPSWSCSHGTFAVGLGVFVPEVAEHLMSIDERPAFLRDYHCPIRMDLQSLRDKDGSGSWDARAGPDVIGEIKSDLEEYGFGFLDEFSSRDRIAERFVAHWDDAGEGVAASLPARLVCAVIDARRGRRERAAERLREQIAITGGPDTGHAPVVRTLGRRLGLPDL